MEYKDTDQANRSPKQVTDMWNLCVIILFKGFIGAFYQISKNDLHFFHPGPDGKKGCAYCAYNSMIKNSIYWVYLALV